MSRSIGNNPLILPLSGLTRGWKRPELIKVDIEPETITNQNSRDAEETTTNEQSICVVCQQNISRYTCPKCQIQYCSIECYRNHNNITNPRTTKTTTSTMSSCTEEFYQQKVTSIMKLENIETQNETHNMLNEFHQNQNTISNKYLQNNADDHNDDDHDLEQSLLCGEELYQLWSKLEDLGHDIDKMSISELTKIMPSSLRTLFERDLQQGKIQNLILKDWFPWWRRELVASGNTAEEMSKEDQIITDKTTRSTASHRRRRRRRRHEQTLDERILKIPKFEELTNKKSSQKESILHDKTLLYNLMDILYAICMTLRMYHGLQNASNNEPIEAVMTLVTTSSVLSKDARFNTLTEALVNCTEKTQSSRSVSSTVHWTTLIEDVALLVTSHRLIGRALLEAFDLFKAAINELKNEVGVDETKNDKSSRQSHMNDDELGDCKKQLTKLRQFRKKLEYFLSWSQHPSVKTLLVESNLKEPITAWCDDWKTFDLVNEEMKHELDMECLKIPQPSTTSQNSEHCEKDSIDQSELMVEVQSRKFE